MFGEGVEEFGMRDAELFGMALGLTEPWFVEWTELDAGAWRLDLYLDFRRGAVFAYPPGAEPRRCPPCGGGRHQPQAGPPTT